MNTAMSNSGSTDSHSSVTPNSLLTANNNNSNPLTKVKYVGRFLQQLGHQVHQMVLGTKSDENPSQEEKSNEPASSLWSVRTIVLVGKAGNGKSATGNSILSGKPFKSMLCPMGVTSTCELRSSTLEHGQVVNVIDTPGLFDFSAENEEHGEEIVKCVNMANGGIHAVLWVLSVRSRFTREEQAVVECLRDFFGKNITNYIIIVFTGGDDLGDDTSLDDYLDICPKNFKDLLNLCGNRCVLFDNKTKNQEKISVQLSMLHSVVDMVVKQNGGMPYTNALFKAMREAAELRKRAEMAEADFKRSQQMAEADFKRSQQEFDLYNKLHDEKMVLIRETVEKQMERTTRELQERLTMEQAQSNDALGKAYGEIEKLRKKLERRRKICTIM